MTNTDKAVRLAQAIILVHSVIFAVEGLYHYSMLAGEWANNRFGDQSQKVRRIH